MSDAVVTEKDREAAHAIYVAWTEPADCEHGEDDDMCTAIAQANGQKFASEAARLTARMMTWRYVGRCGGRYEWTRNRDEFRTVIVRLPDHQRLSFACGWRAHGRHMGYL